MPRRCIRINKTEIMRSPGARRRAGTTVTRACLKCITAKTTQPRVQRLVWARSSSDDDTAPQTGAMQTMDKGMVDRLDQAPREGPEAEQFEDKSETLPVKLALSMLHFYKTGISPLMPPSCRFQPTCSSYAVDAYTRYGVTKGTIMTAWRLFRCTPWGDRGYDPAIWPPKGLGFLEKK